MISSPRFSNQFTQVSINTKKIQPEFLGEELQQFLCWCLESRTENMLYTVPFRVKLHMFTWGAKSYVSVVCTLWETEKLAKLRVASSVAITVHSIENKNMVNSQ
jgi:hypothetical protein